MAFCHNCGSRVPDAAVRCPGCGAPVAAAAQEHAETTSAGSIDPGMTPSIQQHAREGRKIQAIKEYREATGASLKDAKDAVEAWMRAEGIVGQGAGCGTSALLLVAIGGFGLLALI